MINAKSAKRLRQLIIRSLEKKHDDEEFYSLSPEEVQSVMKLDLLAAEEAYLVRRYGFLPTGTAARSVRNFPETGRGRYLAAKAELRLVRKGEPGFTPNLTKQQRNVAESRVKSAFWASLYKLGYTRDPAGKPQPPVAKVAEVAEVAELAPTNEPAQPPAKP